MLDAPVRPRFADGAVQELDALTQADRRRRPPERGEARVGALAPSAAAVVAGPADARRVATPSCIEPSRRSTRSTRSSRPLVPHQLDAFVDLVAERHRARRRRRALRRAGCGSDRACRRGRRRRGTPRGRAGRCRAATRPTRCGAGTARGADAPPAGRETRGATRRPARSASIRSASNRISHATRQIGRPDRAAAGPCADRPDRARSRPASTRRRSDRSAGRSSGRPRSMSRSSIRTASAHPSGVGSATSMRARRGCTGRPSIRRPTSVVRPSPSSASRSRSSRLAGAQRLARVAASRTTARRPGCPMRRARAPGRRGRPRRSRAPGEPHGCRARSCSRGGSRPPPRRGPARPARWSADDRLVVMVVRRVMPVRASKRGARASPESTTTRTPSTVSDVSAMSVLSTTRRRPGRDGASARSWSASESAPASGYTSTSGPTTPTRADCVRMISPIPGRNTSTSPGSSRSARWTAAVVASSMRSRRCRGTHLMSTGCIRPSLAITGASPSTPTRAAVSGVADIARMRRSGRSVAATSRASANPRSVGRLRSWTSSNTTRPTPGSSGSFWRRRVRMPSVTTSTRVPAPMWRSSRVW